MKELGIGEVARRSGVAASTLRYYEEKGLIRSVGRRGLSRVFNADVLEKLALITLAQSLTFSLEDIAQMIEQGHTALDRQRLSDKADELDRTIKQLSIARDELRRAAVCPAASHVECPSFQRLLKETSREDRPHNPSALQRKEVGPEG